MPCEYQMRCSELWASSPDLRGSWHPYPLLPTTHLADFCLLQVNVEINSWERWCFDMWIYRFDVEAMGLSGAFCFVPFFVSLPPRYFLPVRNNAMILGLSQTSMWLQSAYNPLPSSSLFSSSLYLPGVGWVMRRTPFLASPHWGLVAVLGWLCSLFRLVGPFFFLMLFLPPFVPAYPPTVLMASRRTSW